MQWFYFFQFYFENLSNAIVDYQFPTTLVITIFCPNLKMSDIFNEKLFRFKFKMAAEL